MPLKKLDLAQQDQIIEKLRAIVCPDGASFTLYGLDSSAEKQQQIMDLLPELQANFYIGKESALQAPHKLKRPWLSILKCFLAKRYEIMIEDYRDPNAGVRTKRYHLRPVAPT